MQNQNSKYVLSVKNVPSPLTELPSKPHSLIRGAALDIFGGQNCLCGPMFPEHTANCTSLSPQVEVTSLTDSDSGCLHHHDLKTLTFRVAFRKLCSVFHHAQ